MSDESPTSPKRSATAAAKSAPHARRAAKPRPKKVAKTASAAEESVLPVAPEIAPRDAEPAEYTAAVVGGDWPEPEAESAGGAALSGEPAKRKRRRRKGKSQANDTSNEEAQLASANDSAPRPAPQAQPPPRPKIDPERLTKMAWKIFLAEISEEGVALIGDNDAKDLSRRCFRLAEIFIEEQSRRR